jgi:hypothetical protein
MSDKTLDIFAIMYLVITINNINRHDYGAVGINIALLSYYVWLRFIKYNHKLRNKFRKGEKC